LKALVKAKAEPGIWVQDVPVPEIGPNDVLIKVRKASICGTDIHIWNWDAWSQKTIKVPMVIGHEFMGELKACLEEASGARYRLVATDGVFSMDGIIANLGAICDLADRHRALVMVDDSHAVGFVGAKGKGTPEYCKVMDRVDILTGTLGKALGGASGGYTSGRKEIVAWLRQRSRPYLFSNSLMPAICAATLTVLDLLEGGDELRKQLRSNAEYFRAEMTRLGFKLAGADHPIIPVMLGDAKLASTFADQMLAEGVYVIGFSFPVVPQGQARIRTQMSAAHTRAQLDRAIAAFAKVGRALGVIR